VNINHPTIQGILKINRRAILNKLGTVLEDTSVTCLWVGDGFPIAISMSSQPRSHPDFSCRVTVFNPILKRG